MRLAVCVFRTKLGMVRMPRRSGSGRTSAAAAALPDRERYIRQFSGEDRIRSANHCKSPSIPTRLNEMKCRLIVCESHLRLLRRHSECEIVTCCVAHIQHPSRGDSTSLPPVTGSTRTFAGERKGYFLRPPHPTVTCNVAIAPVDSVNSCAETGSWALGQVGRKSAHTDKEENATSTGAITHRSPAVVRSFVTSDKHVNNAHQI